MAQARQRKGASGRGGLPTRDGDSKSRKAGSSNTGLILAALCLAVLATGAIMFKEDIMKAIDEQVGRGQKNPEPEVPEMAKEDPVEQQASDVNSESAQPVSQVTETSTENVQDSDVVREERSAPEDPPGTENGEPAAAGGESKPAAAPTSTVTETGERLFTVEELKQYDGSDASKPIYLAIVGQVFDVTKGKDHYSKDGGYSFFSGKDGTRAFVSGDFTEAGLIDNVTGLSNANIIGLEDWLHFYHKDYTYAGKVVGNFYDAQGQPAGGLVEYKRMLKEAQGEHLAEEELKKIFPPCNSHWAQGKGGTVWCSKESGGIRRDWIGVPRRMFKAGTTDYRCVCVRTTGKPSIGGDDGRNIGDMANPNMRAYDYCHPESATCAIKP